MHMLPGRMLEEGGTTMRRGLSSYGYYRGLPFVYPITPFFLPRRAEQLCAERLRNHHTLGRTWGTMRLIVLIIPGLEPRLSSRDHGRRGR